MSGEPGRYSPLIASAIILIGVTTGWILMPRIMMAVSGGGPLAIIAVAVAFVMAFFGVLWLRARHQRRIHGN